MSIAKKRARIMWLVILEAFGAAALLVFIVWWTMFSGRRRGERDPGPSEH
jgi:ABC-type transporter Mla subunit MlaD